MVDTRGWAERPAGVLWLSRGCYSIVFLHSDDGPDIAGMLVNLQSLCVCSGHNHTRILPTRPSFQEDDALQNDAGQGLISKVGIIVELYFLNDSTGHRLEVTGKSLMSESLRIAICYRGPQFRLVMAGTQTDVCPRARRGAWCDDVLSHTANSLG